MIDFLISQGIMLYTYITYIIIFIVLIREWLYNIGKDILIQIHKNMYKLLFFLILLIIIFTDSNKYYLLTLFTSMLLYLIHSRYVSINTAFDLLYKFSRYYIPKNINGIKILVGTPDDEKFRKAFIKLRDDMFGLEHISFIIDDLRAYLYFKRHYSSDKWDVYKKDYKQHYDKFTNWIKNNIDNMSSNTNLSKTSESDINRIEANKTWKKIKFFIKYF